MAIRLLIIATAILATGCNTETQNPSYTFDPTLNHAQLAHQAWLCEAFMKLSGDAETSKTYFERGLHHAKAHVALSKTNVEYAERDQDIGWWTDARVNGGWPSEDFYIAKLHSGIIDLFISSQAEVSSVSPEHLWKPLADLNIVTKPEVEGTVRQFVAEDCQDGAS